VRSQLSTGVASAAQNHDLRQRQIIGMGDCQERRNTTHRFEPARGAAVQLQLRRTAVADDFNVAPQHAVRVACPERLHRRFFGGEPAREMNRRNFAAGTVRHLTVREDPPKESLAVAIDRVGNAIDIGGVKTESKNGRHATAPA